MHITIGAAILILGLLFLATFPAGRKVLGVVFVLIVFGLVGIGYVLNQQEKETQARNAAAAAEQSALVAERHAACQKKYPVDPNVRDIIAELQRDLLRDCEAGRIRQ